MPLIFFSLWGVWGTSILVHEYLHTTDLQNKTGAYACISLGGNTSSIAFVGSVNEEKELTEQRHNDIYYAEGVTLGILAVLVCLLYVGVFIIIASFKECVYIEDCYYYDNYKKEVDKDADAEKYEERGGCTDNSSELLE